MLKNCVIETMYHVHNNFNLAVHSRVIPRNVPRYVKGKDCHPPESNIKLKRKSISVSQKEGFAFKEKFTLVWRLSISEGVVLPSELARTLADGSARPNNSTTHKHRNQFPDVSQHVYHDYQLGQVAKFLCKNKKCQQQSWSHRLGVTTVLSDLTFMLPQIQQRQTILGRCSWFAKDMTHHSRHICELVPKLTMIMLGGY